jgi:hypothetical protein
MTKTPRRKGFSYRGRGRPRFTDYFDIGPDGEYIDLNPCTLTDEERRRNEAEYEALMTAPIRGPGCPADEDTNRSLVKEWIIAERAGKKNKSAFVRRWFKSWYDEEASPTDVKSYVKRLRRELSKGVMPSVEAGESTGAVSEPDAPGTPARK